MLSPLIGSHVPVSLMFDAHVLSSQVLGSHVLGSHVLGAHVPWPHVLALTLLRTHMFGAAHTCWTLMQALTRSTHLCP
jgi:hypothetical protein